MDDNGGRRGLGMNTTIDSASARISDLPALATETLGQKKGALSRPPLSSCSICAG
jgi:hypothetical protein